MSQKKVSNSPAAIRALPFVIFLFLTFLQGKFGEESRYWFYLLKTVVGIGMVGTVWNYIAELDWNFSGAAIIVGILVFSFWVGMDSLYPHLGEGAEPWNPYQQFGSNSFLAVLFVAVRMIGSTLVVPPLEEVFYRSFVYRSIVRPNFQAVPLGEFHWIAFLMTSTIFGLTHREWLAGIFCGFLYQGLVCWKKRLGDAMAAHAITNFLLGFWVIWKGDWSFW